MIVLPIFYDHKKKPAYTYLLYIIYLSITFENLILCNKCLSPLRSWRGVLDTTLSDKVSQ